MCLSLLQWEGEIIGMQHLRIVPGRNIAIGGNALTSSFMDDVYEAGTPGKFLFSSFELGATSTLEFPRPMGMDFTVGYLVSALEQFYSWIFGECTETTLYCEQLFNDAIERDRVY